MTTQAEQWSTEGGTRDQGGKQLDAMAELEAAWSSWRELLHEPHDPKAVDWPDPPWVKGRGRTPSSDPHHSTPGCPEEPNQLQVHPGTAASIPLALLAAVQNRS